MFIESWGEVLQVGRGWSPFTLWPHQREIVQAKYGAIRKSIDFAAGLDYSDPNLDLSDLGERHVDLKSRQVGFTTITCALSVHDMMFNKNHPWILVSQGLEEAKGTLGDRKSVV